MRAWWALILVGCGHPSEGTFVGNPGSLTVAPAGTSGLSLSDGGTQIAAMTLTGCDGTPVELDLPEGRVPLRWSREAAAVIVPAGVWCKLDVTLVDLRLDLLGERPVLVEIPSHTLALQGELVVEDEQQLALVLGHAGWLTPTLDLLPGEDGVVHVADHPEIAAALTASLAGSALFGPDGAALQGSEFDVYTPEPSECELPIPAVQPVIQDCANGQGYEVSTWEAEAACDPPLWVAGIYQTHGEHSGGVHPMGYATVQFDLPGTHLLALSSYEPVTWTVQLGPDTTLARVLVAGYHEQIVAGIPDVPVEFVSGPACGYAVPGDPNEGCTGEALIEAFERAAGVPATRFDGCYDASSFRWAPAP